MPQDTDDPAEIRSGGVLQLRHALPLQHPPREEPGRPVSVTVVGVDVRARQRVIELLAGNPGLRVVGWAESVQALGVLDLSSEVCLTVESGRVNRPAGEVPEPLAAPEPVRPELSARQQEVLAAYSAGNELLDVVARRLGMGAETLKTHLRRIRVKYEAAGRPAPTRRDLYVRAIEDGLVPPPR